jgi:hypothetical protein
LSSSFFEMGAVILWGNIMGSTWIPKTASPVFTGRRIAACHSLHAAAFTSCLDKSSSPNRYGRPRY